ncbi:CPBP family intramembrane glutamic endopeptidase [Jannaschia aquimarina]|uniref:CAAX amino terminal protease self-immunity n=1 Tax=Jannaschia aquimarina TaxID=935700 RepID=A0A0D1EHM5_9RHOB|nr:CPBP family intramembrane glutamic endopeptidase [Jannaschia aquimarina]KIT16356.1 CAAX amino terminal protease self- immunity [Jannaschia aquimarina]SNT25677.1 hypothetical protein SAMN05421775_10933 [Jannaschia aquimarina]
MLWTRPFADWVADARSRPDLPGLIIGVVIAEIGFVLGAILVVAPEGRSAETPWDTVRSFLAFWGLFAGTILAARWVQRRDLSSLLGAVHLAHFKPAFLIALGVGTLPVLLWGFPPADGGLSAAPFMLWVPLALLAISIQAGAEEIFFRGYLQTQLAARFESPLAWMVFPSAWFALLHVDLSPAAGAGLAAADWAYIVWAFAFGLMAADLARVTGGLMASWGWHVGMNAYATLVFASEGQLSGLALFLLPAAPAEGPAAWHPLALVAELLLLVITWAGIRLWLATRD